MGTRRWLAILPLCTIFSARADAPLARRLSAAELPAGIEARGSLVSALAWRDASGERVAAFWRKHNQRQGSARLQVDLWSAAPGRPSAIVRSVKDAVLDCEFDLTAEFVEQALGVTDLDRDGVAELTFAYRTGCASDVSPVTLKLLLLEGKQKYIVRGSTRVDVGPGERVGGDKKIDPALARVPPFREHALRVWSTIVAL